MNNLEKAGLILEGGGMRGVYTTGVLDFFMDKSLYFSYVIGVSMGACNGASYISKQRGRTKAATIDYVNDPRYLSYRNLLKYKSIFGMDFIFEEIPTKIIPFDFETFFNYEGDFVIGTTNCITGEEVYFSKSDYTDKNVLNIIKASSSLPFVAKPLNINNHILMDGGLADPIPIKKSIKHGNKKNVLILTREPDYLKKPYKFKWITSKKYPKYKGLCDALINRSSLYNETMQYISELEKSGEVFVIRPKTPPIVKRIEKDKAKMNALYLEGYKDAENSYDKLMKYLAE